MTKHKWFKEIKAWVDGAVIQFKDKTGDNEWIDCVNNIPAWELRGYVKYRIKPQPKDEAIEKAIDFLDGSYKAHAVRKALQEALTQPAKEWVGLSDDEMDKIFCEVSDNCINYFPSELNVAWFKALKEKNEK